MTIASIMSKVVPGSFAPDMGGSEAPAVSAIPGGAASPIAGIAAPPADAASPLAPSFAETVKGLLNDVNGKLTGSDEKMRDLASGKTHDLNTVITSVEEANLSLQYTMALRTKLLDAYSEIERMNV